jgi:hypothetical protein
MRLGGVIADYRFANGTSVRTLAKSPLPCSGQELFSPGRERDD